MADGFNYYIESAILKPSDSDNKGWKIIIAYGDQRKDAEANIGFTNETSVAFKVYAQYWTSETSIGSSYLNDSFGSYYIKTTNSTRNNLKIYCSKTRPSNLNPDFIYREVKGISTRNGEDGSLGGLVRYAPLGENGSEDGLTQATLLYETWAVYNNTEDYREVTIEAVLEAYGGKKVSAQITLTLKPGIPVPRPNNLLSTTLSYNNIMGVEFSGASDSMKESIGEGENKKTYSYSLLNVTPYGNDGLLCAEYSVFDTENTVANTTDGSVEKNGVPVFANVNRYGLTVSAATSNCDTYPNGYSINSLSTSRDSVWIFPNELKYHVILSKNDATSSDETSSYDLIVKEYDNVRYHLLTSGTKPTIYPMSSDGNYPYTWSNVLNGNESSYYKPASCCLLAIDPITLNDGNYNQTIYNRVSGSEYSRTVRYGKEYSQTEFDIYKSGRKVKTIALPKGVEVTYDFTGNTSSSAYHVIYHLNIDFDEELCKLDYVVSTELIAKFKALVPMIRGNNATDSDTDSVVEIYVDYEDNANSRDIDVSFTYIPKNTACKILKSSTPNLSNTGVLKILETNGQSSTIKESNSFELFVSKENNWVKSSGSPLN